MFDRPLSFWERNAPYLIVFICILRLILGGLVGLGDDEAYYWDWSRNLQLSYYDHPGMVAWLIKASCTLFGQNAFAVRLPFILCNSLATLFLALLALDQFNLRTAIWAALLHTFVPLYAIGGMMAVPDAPMGMFWALAAWISWRIFSLTLTAGLFNSDERIPFLNWCVLGIVVGLGILSKYTFVLLPASLLLFMLTDHRFRRLFLVPGFGAAFLIAVVAGFPILIWNAQNGWASFAFHLSERQHGGGGMQLARWVQFWGSQLAYYSPLIFLLNLLALLVSLIRSREPQWKFLFWLSAPTLALFTMQALFAEFKPHWTAPAHFSLLIATAKLFEEGFEGREEFQKAFRRKVIFWANAVFVIPLFVLYHFAVVAPILPSLASAINSHVRWEAKFDPTNDLYGWDQLAKHLEKLRAEREQNGIGKPYLASSRYQLVSQLAFATKEKVYRLSPGTDQYTFWQSPKVIESLKDRPMLFISDNRYERDPRNDADYTGVFSMCAELEPLHIRRGKIYARTFSIYECR